MTPITSEALREAAFRMLRPSAPGFRIATTAALVAVLASCVSAQAGDPTASIAQECTAQEVERFRLRTSDGRQYYIEPRFMAASGGSVLLFGKPSYVFTADTINPDFVSRHNVSGVLIESDGTTRLIPDLRAGAKVIPVALTALGDDSWAAIFLEFAADADTLEWVDSANESGYVRHIWYAEYRQGQWVDAVELPMGELARMVELNGSPLVVSGDTAVWAVPATSKDSTRYAAVFERIGGRWVQHALERAPFLPISYAVLSHTPSHGFLLGLVRADSAPGYRFNSLFLYDRRSEWRRLRGVIPGESEPVHHPTLHAVTGDSLAVTWLGKGATGALAGRAFVGDLAGEVRPILTISPEAKDTPAVVTGLARGVLWVADRYRGEAQLEIRLEQARGDRIHTLWEADNPYTGYFAAVASKRNEILISGPLFEPGRSLVTLLIRLRLQCRDA
jgi:hypothetical protein